jgi:hypothetical protein
VVNDPLVAGRPAPDYRFERAPATGKNTNSLFVCLAFSGGGTRAAALAYGVLEKLRQTRITWKGEEKSLLDEVDCISSISGGSFTAAYYGLFGARIFQEFRPRFLDVNVERALVARAANPLNWLRLVSRNFDRIDLAAEYYDEAIFEGKRFEALAEPGRRPFVILNATNLANGERFEFTQDQFDVLVSDLSTFPVARAVAASSAFPFLLSPVSLKNYPHPAGFMLPRDIREGLTDYEANRRRYYWARNRALYVDDARLPYLHLMDGGPRRQYRAPAHRGRLPAHQRVHPAAHERGRDREAGHHRGECGDAEPRHHQREGESPRGGCGGGEDRHRGHGQLHRRDHRGDEGAARDSRARTAQSGRLPAPADRVPGRAHPAAAGQRDRALCGGDQLRGHRRPPPGGPGSGTCPPAST